MTTHTDRFFHPLHFFSTLLLVAMVVCCGTVSAHCDFCGGIRGFVVVFPSHAQGFLLYSGMIFLAVAMFQWTWLEDKYDNTGGGDPKIAHATLRQAVDWTMAVCGIFAGMAPSHTLDSVLSNKKRK